MLYQLSFFLNFFFNDQILFQVDNLSTTSQLLHVVHNHVYDMLYCTCMNIVSKKIADTETLYWLLNVNWLSFTPSKEDCCGMHGNNGVVECV